MEYYSDMGRQTIGGPWRAKEEGCKYFIYYFINSDTFFTFYTDLMVQSLNYIIKDMRLVPITNVGWITAGYPIDKKFLLPIAYTSGIRDSKTLGDSLNGLKNKIDKLDYDVYLNFIDSNR
jgi:hypothetical protein